MHMREQGCPAEWHRGPAPKHDSTDHRYRPTRGRHIEEDRKSFSSDSYDAVRINLGGLAVEKPAHLPEATGSRPTGRLMTCWITKFLPPKPPPCSRRRRRGL